GLSQVLQNFATQGMGIVKHTWAEEYKYGPSTPQLGPNNLLQPAQGSTSTVCFQGNKLRFLSPMQWFPDVRLPLVRFEEGEFCASEELYSWWQLKMLQKQGLCAGVELLKETS